MSQVKPPAVANCFAWICIPLGFSFTTGLYLAHYKPYTKYNWTISYGSYSLYHSPQLQSQFSKVPMPAHPPHIFGRIWVAVNPRLFKPPVIKTITDWVAKKIIGLV